MTSAKACAMGAEVSSPERPNWTPPPRAPAPVPRNLPTPPDDYRWIDIKKFARLFKDNVLTVSDRSSYVFVNHEHPVARIIICKIPDCPRIDGAWLKVDKKTFRVLMMVIFCLILRWNKVSHAMKAFLQRRRRLAVAMALHSRLGARSSLHLLGLDPILQIVASSG